MASSRSEENVNLKHFQHLMVSQWWCVLQFFFLGHFYLVYLADVIASVYLPNIVVFGRCYCHMPYCGRCCTTRSDVITCCLLWYRCCYHMVYIMTCCFDMFGRCYCHCFCDWWHCHILISDVDILADVVPSGNVPLFIIVAVGSFIAHG